MIIIAGLIALFLAGSVFGWMLRGVFGQDLLSSEEWQASLKRETQPSCMHAETDDGKPCCICCGQPGPSPCQACDAHLDKKHWDYCSWGCLPCSFVGDCPYHKKQV